MHTYILRFIKTVFTGLIPFLFLSCNGTQSKKKDRNADIAGPGRPNIVLILGDDLGYGDVSAYGNTRVHTPHIQELADNGMCFDNMFTSTAMCSPTRQQILTGLYPVRNGAYPNHSHVYEGTRSVAHYMQDAGYRTAITGKRDFGNKASFPFTFLGGQNWDNGKGRGIDLQKAREYMEKGGKPYFLVVASNQPHVPWVRGNADAYPPEGIEVPGYLVDTPETRQALSKYYAEVTYLDSLVGQCVDMVRQSSGKDNTIIVFTSEQGAQFPFAKWTCYDQGLKTAFIINWPGRISPGSRNSALTQYVDVVPTLLDLAGVDPDTVNTGNKAVNGETGFDGKSFRNVLFDGENAFRDYVYGVHTTRGIINGSDNYPVRSVRNKEYLYIHNLNASETFTNIETRQGVVTSWKKKDRERAEAYSHRPEKELYDVRKDPYQLNNLAPLPEYEDVIRKMDRELQAFMGQQGDEGMLTEARAGMRRNKQ
ncbi:sulfatase family protein [Sinomicrobium soli]|uniref:sulfatase family protein n=1 Tax=Sinomicrobium sp. N-1-3-6 TaxID=2219864 RepID=UPI001374DD2C|nr:sulfatase [Sinomicrobium sp. N-1-3-6]